MNKKFIDRLRSYDSWLCIHYATQREVPEIESLAHDHFFVRGTRAENLADLRDLRSELGRLFEFPDWCGDAYAAVSDCLGDFQWLDADGFVLMVSYGPDQELTPGLRMLQQLWPDAAQVTGQHDKKPMHLVFVQGN